MRSEGEEVEVGGLGNIYQRGERFGSVILYCIFIKKDSITTRTASFFGYWILKL